MAKFKVGDILRYKDTELRPSGFRRIVIRVDSFEYLVGNTANSIEIHLSHGYAEDVYDKILNYNKFWRSFK